MTISDNVGQDSITDAGVKKNVRNALVRLYKKLNRILERKSIIRENETQKTSDSSKNLSQDETDEGFFSKMWYKVRSLWRSNKQ
jgi:hypothetical protein